MPDSLQSRFSAGTNVPQLCSALEKGALDPRVVGICFEVGGRRTRAAGAPAPGAGLSLQHRRGRRAARLPRGAAVLPLVA